MSRLFKRGKIWHVYVYQNGIRRSRSTGCTVKKAAQARARELERRAADPDYAAAHQATITAALELLLKDRAEKAQSGKGSTHTVDFYRKKAGHLVRVLEVEGEYAPVSLATLDARSVDAYISQRRSEGARESTIAKEIVTLRAALKLARRRKLWFGEVAGAPRRPWIPPNQTGTGSKKQSVGRNPGDNQKDGNQRHHGVATVKDHRCHVWTGTPEIAAICFCAVAAMNAPPTRAGALKGF